MCNNVAVMHAAAVLRSRLKYLPLHRVIADPSIFDSYQSRLFSDSAKSVRNGGSVLQKNVSVKKTVPSNAYKRPETEESFVLPAELAKKYLDGIALKGEVTGAAMQVAMFSLNPTRLLLYGVQILKDG